MRAALYLKPQSRSTMYYISIPQKFVYKRRLNLRNLGRSKRTEKSASIRKYCKKLDRNRNVLLKKLTRRECGEIRREPEEFDGKLDGSQADVESQGERASSI